MDDKFLPPRVEGARGPEMEARLKDIAAVGDCEFCNLAAGVPKRHKHPVAVRWSHWLATLSDFPYEGTRVHILVISQDHVNNLGELSLEALAELAPFMLAVAIRFNLTGYSIVGRVGNRALTAQTIPHLCFHLAESDGKDVSSKLEEIDSRTSGVISRLPKWLMGDSEALKVFVRALNLWRSWLDKKAFRIDVKVSNDVIGEPEPSGEVSG